MNEVLDNFEIVMKKADDFYTVEAEIGKGITFSNKIIYLKIYIKIIKFKIGNFSSVNIGKMF